MRWWRWPLERITFDRSVSVRKRNQGREGKRKATESCLARLLSRSGNMALYACEGSGKSIDTLSQMWSHLTSPPIPTIIRQPPCQLIIDYSMPF
jgi:hypothetical protein